MTRLKVICQIFAWQRARSLFDGQRNGKRKYDFRQKLEALNVEGMVMKRKDSVYAYSRCRDWLKVKTAAGKMTMQKRIETCSSKKTLTHLRSFAAISQLVEGEK